MYVMIAEFFRCIRQRYSNIDLVVSKLKSEATSATYKTSPEQKYSCGIYANDHYSNRQSQFVRQHKVKTQRANNNENQSKHTILNYHDRLRWRLLFVSPCLVWVSFLYQIYSKANLCCFFGRRRIARLLAKESKNERSIKTEKGSQRFNNNKKLSSKQKE